MSAVVCTCIRHERDARQIAVPDPTCPHGTVDADRDAQRAARMLGRALAWTVVATICAGLFLTTDQHWTTWHWLTAAANTVLAVRLATTGDTP